MLKQVRLTNLKKIKRVKIMVIITRKKIKGKEHYKSSSNDELYIKKGRKHVSMGKYINRNRCNTCYENFFEDFIYLLI